MRFDKLTTKFQQALAAAQSMASRSEHPYIEPVHVLSALLADARAVPLVCCHALVWLSIGCKRR